MVKPATTRMVRVPADDARLLVNLAAVLMQHYRERGTPFPPEYEARVFEAITDVTAALGNMRQ